jgi:hypothetical protein
LHAILLFFPVSFEKGMKQACLAAHAEAKRIPGATWRWYYAPLQKYICRLTDNIFMIS